MQKKLHTTTGEKVRIETPLGDIESDSGNHFIDIVTVFLLISVLFGVKSYFSKRG